MYDEKYMILHTLFIIHRIYIPGEDDTYDFDIPEGKNRKKNSNFMAINNNYDK